MKQFFFLFLFLPVVLSSQVTVISVVPANNTKNVPLTTTISVTFSEVIDTVAMKNNTNDSQFSNVDSVISQGFSADGKTVFTTAVLKANHPYFISIIYVKTKSGAILNTPFVSYFTTGADFPPYSVSGTLLAGTSGFSIEGSVVGLSSRNILQEGEDGPPPFVGWANVNSNGTYTIPYMVPGTYWPLAVKDVDHDGRINPESGTDALALHDSIVITNASLTNVDMTYTKFTPQLLHESIAKAETLAVKNLPADRVLRKVLGYDADTLGRARDWEFIYTVNGNTAGKGIKIGITNDKVFDIDQNYFNWVRLLKPILNLSSAATSASVITAVENAGGKAFRKIPDPPGSEFRIEIELGDARYGWFGGRSDGGFDTNKVYWMVAYVHNHQVTNDSSNWVDGKFFLCDMNSGAVLLTQTLDVKNEPMSVSEFSLMQNYPNPFNPSTTIRFTLKKANVTTLKIYDVLGREIAELMNEKKEAGEYTVPFNGSNLTSGIYFYQLRSGSFAETRKMMLVK